MASGKAFSSAAWLFGNTRTQWHQDLPFWPLIGEGMPSIWLAFTQTDNASSAVQYIEGSHKWPIRFAPLNAEEREHALKTGILVCPDFHESTESFNKLFTHSLLQGNVVVHHPLLVHGSGPNHSKAPRIAVSFRYMSEDMLWHTRQDAIKFPAACDLPLEIKMSEQHVFRRCTH